MAHSGYSPNLTPSDYHLFGQLRESLRGRQFTSDQEVEEAVHALLPAQPKTFFSEGIRKLVQ
jgi:histone-lysine N-methyltransferase SETMAR